MVDIKEELNRIQAYMQYGENTDIDVFLQELKEQGILLSEDGILKKYNELKSLERVLSYYYDFYEEKFEKIDADKNIDFNSDSVHYLIKRILQKHLDTKELPDMAFIEDAMEYIYRQCPKQKQQEEIMHVFSRLIECAKLNGVSSLHELSVYYDLNAFFDENIRKCHHRDAAFKELIRLFYETFEDANRNLYRI